MSYGDKPADERIEQGAKMTWGDLDAALEQVNVIRGALAIGEGKLDKLPSGVPGDVTQCVLARALSNGWQSYVSRHSHVFRPIADTDIDYKRMVQELRDVVKDDGSPMFDRVVYQIGYWNNENKEMTDTTDPDDETIVEMFDGDFAQDIQEGLVEKVHTVKIGHTDEMLSLIEAFDGGHLPFLLQDHPQEGDPQDDDPQTL